MTSKPQISAQVPGHGLFTAQTANVEITLIRSAGKPISDLRRQVAERVPDLDWSGCSWIELAVILASFGA